MREETSFNRRRFLKDIAVGGTGLTMDYSFHDLRPIQRFLSLNETSTLKYKNKENLDLSPAKWIWYPSNRCLPNTFLWFRKEFDLEELPKSISGWIVAESRYLLFVNGHRIQWGPAPCDPRYSEADPLDAIMQYLKRGKNVLGVQCLFYGHGDGTWPIGKPGLLLKLSFSFLNDKEFQVSTDSTWLVRLGNAWKLGNYKRWFLRALQEERDNRKYPQLWNEIDFACDKLWLQAMICGRNASKPAICNDFPSYDYEIMGNEKEALLSPRTIPMMREFLYPAKKLSYTSKLKWKVPIKEYFDFLMPDAFDVLESDPIKERPELSWVFDNNLGDDESLLLTFEWEEQGVGWPYLSVKASEGTVLELLVHEAHDKNKPTLMNSHFNSWSRFICRNGWNYFETMDFESFRWLQLNIYNFKGSVEIKELGMRRRTFSWNKEPKLLVNDQKIQKVLGAGINTLMNCAQETIVDGMARERQQYSGDGSHQLHAIYSTMGEWRLPYRFINTFGRGSMLNGYFFDSWPAYDRLARTMERQLGLTGWGPILDHSVGFCFDCWYYYLYTGDLTPVEPIFPNLIHFFEYLKSILASDGLLPVDNLGLPSVWMDHHAFHEQREKKCAFNLYVSAMCINALALLAKAFGENSLNNEITRFGSELLKSTRNSFWDPDLKVFVNNLPWRNNGNSSFDDRSLSTSIIFDQCVGSQNSKALQLLVEEPKYLGISYPANAIWRYWALIKGRKIQRVIDDLRTRWYGMKSVSANNTLQEDWNSQPDDSSQWSHCAVSPLIVMHMGIAGIVPIKPSYSVFKIEPQFGDLKSVEIRTHTVIGDIDLQMNGEMGSRIVTLKTPKDTETHLILDAREDSTQFKYKYFEESNKKEFIINNKDDTELKFKLRYS